MLSIAHFDKVDNSDNESCDGDGPRDVNLLGHGHDHTDAHRKRQTINAGQSWKRKRQRTREINEISTEMQVEPYTGNVG